MTAHPVIPRFDDEHLQLQPRPRCSCGPPFWLIDRSGWVQFGGCGRQEVLEMLMVEAVIASLGRINALGMGLSIPFALNLVVMARCSDLTGGAQCAQIERHQLQRRNST